MITLLNRKYSVDTSRYNIHVNFPGGIPVDGPSAGVAIFTAVYSAIFKKPVPPLIAMTGEISIHGSVKPVGGVLEKVNAAREAGAKAVIIPHENDRELLHTDDVKIIAAETIEDVLDCVFREKSISDSVLYAGGYATISAVSATPQQKAT
jgi:Lon-like ATP-dependent protease